MYCLFVVYFTDAIIIALKPANWQDFFQEEAFGANLD
jgi:hypothetical protein